MICGRCADKPVARGIKSIKCNMCSMESIVHVNHIDVCLSCSDQYNICHRCGDKFARQIEYFDITKQGE